MAPSLWFALACLAVLLGVDLAFYCRYLPGDTISQALAALTARHPVPWHVGYVVLVALGYRHFFM